MVNQKTTRPSRSRSAADWEDAALRAIASHGLRSLAIPELARSLGVTKGSFYWHFSGIQGLIEAALRRWETIDREALDEIRRIADPHERLRALFVQSMETRQAHALFIALSGSPALAVSKTLRRISNGRLRFLVDAYRELGLAPREARASALLAYTAYIGALHLRNQHSTVLRTKSDLAAYVANAVKTLIPDS